MKAAQREAGATKREAGATKREAGATKREAVRRRAMQRLDVQRNQVQGRGAGRL
jgi:hypothetical protein